MAGFDPVGAPPVGAILRATNSGFYISPAPGTLYLGAPAASAGVMLGAKIGKTNIAIESHPVPGIIIGKSNVAVESHPTPGIMISKGNVAVESKPLPGVLMGKANLAIESILVISTSRGCITILW